MFANAVIKGPVIVMTLDSWRGGGGRQEVEILKKRRTNVEKKASKDKSQKVLKEGTSQGSKL